MLGPDHQQIRHTVSGSDELEPDCASAHEAKAVDAQHRAQWLKLFLKSETFLRLPAANLHALVARMEAVPIKAGRIVIHQGANANNYYIIKEGRCQVVRQLQGSSEPLHLAVLSAGDGFGEDALITRGRRNASVVALEDSCLMRLSRHNFTTLLVNPLLSPVSYTQALSLAARGAVLIDVRSPQEFRRSNLKESINIPLPLLRANLARLDPAADFVTYCNNGNFSAAAAFLLTQHGLRAHVLSGGVKHILQAPSTTMRQVEINSPNHDSSGTAGEAKKQPAPRNTTIVCIERDDAQLWTSLPVPTLVDELRIIEDTVKPKTLRNDAIRCIETDSDAIWAESQLLLSQTRNFIARATPSLVTPSTSIDTAHANTTSVPEEKPRAAEVELGWISDAYLWENALGYRHDPAVSSLIGETALTLQEPVAAAPSQATRQIVVAPGSNPTPGRTASPVTGPTLSEVVRQARTLTAARHRNRQASAVTAALLILATLFWGLQQQASLAPDISLWLQDTLTRLTRVLAQSDRHPSPAHGTNTGRIPDAGSSQKVAPTVRPAHQDNPDATPETHVNRTGPAPEVSLF